MLSTTTLHALLVAAGLAHFALFVASPAIPRILGWRQDTAQLQPLTREVFWTWAAYIWITHLCFGLLSTFGASLLLDRSPLAGLVSGFIATWWAARIGVQFLYFDRKTAPPGLHVRLAEVGLVTFFLSNAAIYGTVAATNLLGR